jgi:hypothetical protein
MDLGRDVRHQLVNVAGRASEVGTAAWRLRNLPIGAKMLSALLKVWKNLICL